MKRTPFLVVAPVMIGGAFLLLLLALMSRVVMRPSPWREQVDYYLQAHPGFSYVSAARAQQPSQFREEMSGPVFRKYANGPVYPASAMTAQPKALQAQGAGQAPPLTYPPEDVWCVTLAQRDGGQTTVFVALHVPDMYQSEWVTHEAAGDPNAVAAAIGCR